MKIPIGLIFLTAISFSCNNRAMKEKALKDFELYHQKVLSFKSAIDGAQNRLRVRKEDYVVAQDHLNQAGTFQLLRTSQERDTQVRAATDQLLKAQQDIKDTQAEIQSLGDSLRSAEVNVARLKEVLKD